MQRKNVLLLLLGINGFVFLKAQDPHFSQFFTTPMSINPALTGNYYGRLIAMANYRNQWSGLGDPFITTSLTGQVKLNSAESHKNIAATSLSLMNDQSMSGAYSTNYISGGGAFHLGLDEEGINRIALGISGTYTHSRIDYSRLVFPQQFTSGGFNTNLSTGETFVTQRAQPSSQPGITFNTGLLYTYNDDDQISFDAGIALFNVNIVKPFDVSVPTQSVYNLPINYDLSLRRTTAYVSYSRPLGGSVFLHANGLFQKQANTQEWQIGGVAAIELSQIQDPSVLNIGAWYRNNDAVIAYGGYSFRLGESTLVQLGASYDITLSGLNSADIKPQTFELSIILRSARPDGSIHCPWK